MASETMQEAAARAKEERVLRAAKKMLESGRVFLPDFSGRLTLEIEIRSGGIQDLRLGRITRDG